jgi:hypothetical protein
MSSILEQAAQQNRQAWDSFRRQGDEGLVAKHVDIAAEILPERVVYHPNNSLWRGMSQASVCSILAVAMVLSCWSGQGLALMGLM